jgi:hypothetical protein
MTTQILTIPVMHCNFVIAPKEPIFADSRDYGFDFDEEELGKELLAPLPASFLRQQNSEAESNELEKVFELFIA